MPEETTEEFSSGGITLSGHVARASSFESNLPALVLCHGFPTGIANAAASAKSFPQLADRIASHMGWVVLSFNFRGTGRSEGQFSLRGWLDDVGAAIDHVRSLDRVGDVWLCGFGTGGALALCAGAARPEVRGVAALAAPADFEDWSNHPRRLLQHARDLGLITSSTFPHSMDSWSRELRDTRPAQAAAELAPRPLLVVHGSDDEAVPSLDARILSDAHGEAELRIIQGAGHALRHDPRAVAILLGWLDRQRHRVVPAPG